MKRLNKIVLSKLQPTEERIGWLIFALVIGAVLAVGYLDAPEYHEGEQLTPAERQAVIKSLDR